MIRVIYGKGHQKGGSVHILFIPVKLYLSVQHHRAEITLERLVPFVISAGLELRIIQIVAGKIRSIYPLGTHDLFV